MKKIFLSALFVLFVISAAFADETVIKLPEPDKTGEMTLIKALSDRHSSREFADADFNLNQLSNLLWATAGVNRSDGHRVYPVAMGIQDIYVYVFTRDGVYKYDALNHSLVLTAAGDHRADTGKQPFVAKAAVNLAYVHDTSLWQKSKAPKEVIRQYGFAHTGAAMQNAYLYAASQGWNAVVRGSFDAEKLSKLLKLSEGQFITLVHSIGLNPSAE